MKSLYFLLIYTSSYHLSALPNMEDLTLPVWNKEARCDEKRPGIRKDIEQWKILPENGIKPGTIELEGKVKVKFPRRSLLSFLSRHEPQYTHPEANYQGGAIFNGVKYELVSFVGYPVSVFSFDGSTYLLTVSPFIMDYIEGVYLYLLQPSNTEFPLLLLQEGVYPDHCSLGNDEDSWQRIKNIYNRIIFESDIHNTFILYELIIALNSRTHYFANNSSRQLAIDSARETIDFLNRKIDRSPSLFFISKPVFERKVCSLPKSYNYPPYPISLETISESKVMPRGRFFDEIDRENLKKRLISCWKNIQQQEEQGKVNIPVEYKMQLNSLLNGQ